MPFARRHHRLEARAPAGGDGVEPQARRGRDPPGGEAGDQLLTGTAGGLEVAVAGAEVEPPRVAAQTASLPFGCR
ncbi:MAG TPA: hypothetical protein VGH14_04355 [Solirubrobacterales bacterium]